MATITGANVVLSNQEFNVVGTRPFARTVQKKSPDGLGTGLTSTCPDCCTRRVLRSPHAHARIKSIDISRAEALDGVRGVVTSADLPQPRGRISDQTEAAMVNPKFSATTVWPPRRCCTGATPSLRGGHQPPHRGKGAGAHRSRLRGPGFGHRRAGGHEAGCPGASRTPGHSLQPGHAHRRSAGR